MRAAKQLRGDKELRGESTATPHSHASSTDGLGGAPMASSITDPTDLHTNSSATDASTQRKARANPAAAAANTPSDAASDTDADGGPDVAAGPCVMGAKTGHAATVKWRVKTREMMMTNSMKKIAGRDLTVACDVGAKWGVGGRSGNVVTWSRNKNLHKGWR